MASSSSFLCFFACRLSEFLCRDLIGHVQIVGQASEKVITGTILDEAGLPIVGANVTVKGTSKGTISDVDGVFKL